MTTTLKSVQLTVVAGIFAAMLPQAQAQQAPDRAGAIQQIASKWGSSAGPADQFQATLNAASDGALSQLLSAMSLQQVRAILLGNLAGQAGGNGVMALGDSTQDLVFTPNNPPCRVFDTRFIGAGTAPATGSTSSYQVYGNAATISAQGGNATGCAAPKGEPVAVSANFTAVPVGFQGHIRVFPFGGSLPTVSFVNFNGVVGNNIANSGIVSTCFVCAFDLSVYNGSQTHHIGDVMGYFYPATFGNIDLPTSTGLTGNILKNGIRFIHNFAGTYLGENAGNFTMTGGANTGAGYGTLSSNTTGTINAAIGLLALTNNTTGTSNTASGAHALTDNTTGGFNSAHGTGALENNTTGTSNTAVGNLALRNNVTGGDNIAVGSQAGRDITGNSNIAIGWVGSPSVSNTIWLGGVVHSRAFISGIRGTTTGNANAIPVLIDSAGQLGTASSSRRVKQDIAEMGDASSVLKDLRPVTFRYKAHAEDPTVQYGLIAEEVAETAPGLVARSANGEVETVYYQHLAPMLVNEYQKQQRTIHAQAAEIADLREDREQQKARITALERQAARMVELVEGLVRMEAAAGR